MEPLRVALFSLAVLAACGGSGGAPATARATPGGLTTGPAPLAIVDGRPAFLPTDAPVTRARLAARLPGVEIRSADEADEDVSTTVFTALRGDDELFQLRATPEGEVIALISESAALEHPAGLRVGDRYEALRARGEPECWHEVEWDAYVLCRDPKVAGVTYGFATSAASDGEGEGGEGEGEGGGAIEDLDGERRDALLTGATVELLVWTPPASD